MRTMKGFLLLVIVIFVSTAGATQQAQSEGYVTRNSPRDSKFLVAVRAGDVVSVSSMLRADVSLNSFINVPSEPGGPENETTPLLEAVIGGHAEMVEFLLTRGASANFHSVKTESALHIAAWSGKLDVVKALLRHGAFADERNESGETPLLLAAFHSKDVRVVQELIAAGADIYARDKFGYNAATISVWGHRQDNLKLLSGLGVDPCAKNNEGRTAMDRARSNGNDDPGKQEIIAFLQDKCGGQDQVDVTSTAPPRAQKNR